MNIHFFQKALFIERLAQVVLYCENNRMLTISGVPTLAIAQTIIQEEMGLIIPIEVDA